MLGTAPVSGELRPRSPALQAWGRQLGHGDLLGKVGAGVEGGPWALLWGGRDVPGAVDRAELDTCSKTWAWSRAVRTGGSCVFS